MAHKGKMAYPKGYKGRMVTKSISKSKRGRARPTARLLSK